MQNSPQNFGASHETPLSWSHLQKRVVHDVSQFVRVMEARDKSSWGGLFYLDTFSKWIELAFEHPCLLHGVVAIFLPHFAPAGTDKVDAAVAFHLQHALQGLQTELVRFRTKGDNYAVVEMGSACVQMTYAQNRQAAEWVAVSRGKKALRTQALKAMPRVRRQDFVKINPAGPQWKLTFPFRGKAQAVPSRKIVLRGRAEQTTIEVTLLESCLRVAQISYHSARARVLLARCIAALRSFPSKSIPATPEELFSIWTWQNSTSDIYFDKFDMYLDPTALDLVVSCFVGAIPLVFPNLFFSEEAFTHSGDYFKWIVLKIHDHLQHLPPDGDGRCPFDRMMLLRMIEAPSRLALDFPDLGYN